MYINMTPDKTNKTLHASQDDTTRQFKFKLVNDSQVLDTSDSIPPVIYDVEPNGIEQLLPVNSSAPTTSPIIADIKYPDELREDQEFIERVTPTTLKGQAKIEKIKGNTLVFNQLIENGNFESTNGWGQGGGRSTLTVENNIGTATLINSLSTTYQNYRYVQLVQGHKIFIHYEFKLPRATTRVFGCENNKTADAYVFDEMFNVPANTWHTVNAFHTVVDGGAENMAICYFQTNRDGYQLGDQYQVRNLMVIDLTQMFGSGNEPTSVSDFTDLFPLISYYDYNAGSLLSFNGTGIKSVGFNQWDEQWEIGNWESSDGQSGNLTDRIRSKNYVPILPNTSYYFKAPSQFTTICFYDENKNFISSTGGTSGWYNITWTTPNNAHYMRFNMSAAYGMTYNNDICINISDSSLNGTYEPYKESTTSLPTSTYFPTGMKSAGTVYDELTPTKATTRIGVLNLGSINWDYTTNSRDIPIFVPSGNINARAPGSNNLLCPLYTTIDASSRDGINGDKQLVRYNSSGATKIAISNFDYTDATAFKTAMAGVYLYYELREPTEEDFESYSLVSEDIEKPLEYDSGFLVCDSDGLTSKAGFIPCKVKMDKEDETLYSQLIQLHVERKP